MENPEGSSHALYNSHKQARLTIQNQREQAQHTLSFLEREAKKTARDLEKKQRSLLSYYQLKESRFLDSQQVRHFPPRRKAFAASATPISRTCARPTLSCGKRPPASEHRPGPNYSAATNGHTSRSRPRE
jgi:hypothetical protein